MSEITTTTEAMEYILLENINKDKPMIIHSCGTMYGHLLKYLFLMEKQRENYPSWLSTINNQKEIINKNLYKSLENKITEKDIVAAKNRGIDIFMGDNKNYNISNLSYYIIDEYFHNVPRSFTDTNTIIKFLDDYANDDSIRKHVKEIIK